eukprot:1153433-Pelagomonas_calceolata.AAC.2
MRSHAFAGAVHCVQHHPLLRNTMNTSKRTKKKTELSGFTSQGMGLADLGSEGLAAAQEVFWGACWLLFFLSLFPKTKPASSCTRPVRVQKRVRTQLTFSSSWATSSLRSDNSRSTLPVYSLTTCMTGRVLTGRGGEHILIFYQDQRARRATHTGRSMFCFWVEAPPVMAAFCGPAGTKRWGPGNAAAG